jgi:molybdopterin-guanine dinucleotide biosynthesis protein A
VVVVIATRAATPSLPPDTRVRVARDTTEGEGPLAGIHAGLLAVTTTFAVVAAGDMPHLQRAVLIKMLDLADATSADAVALDDAGDVRPLPLVVRAEPAAQMADALLHSERRSVRDLLDALRVTFVAESTWRALDPSRRTLFDIDEPEDLST